MTGEHYFSAAPGSARTERELTVDLRGERVTVTTAGGVFSPDRLDLGTQVLLRTAPDPAGTELLDLGCGWGPLALAMARTAPTARVWAVDVNERARTLTAANARRLGLGGRDAAEEPGRGGGEPGIVVAAPEEMPADVAFHTIWSNPPIRVGKAALHALLLAWLPRLARGGEAWLVVQRNLGADPLQRWLAEQLAERFDVQRAASAKGYRVLRMTDRA